MTLNLNTHTQHIQIIVCLEVPVSAFVNVPSVSDWLFWGEINVACSCATSKLTDLFVYLKTPQKFSNKINKRKKKIFCPFRGIYLFSVFVLHSQSCLLCWGDTRQWHSLFAAYVRGMWRIALCLSLSVLFAGKLSKSWISVFVPVHHRALR